MRVGTLEIELLANMARLQRDMNEAKGAVGSAMASIEKSVGAAKTALGALGIGLGIGAFAAFIKSSIEATARMKDLGQEAGLTASEISKFEAPARMAGLGLDAVAAAMFKMSKAASDAKDPASTAAQALRSIGLSAEQLKGLKPDQMFEMIARAMGKYGDGLEKNAVMQAIFGKSGREMNRVMAEVAETQKLAATTTDEQAEAADKLDDQIVALKMDSEKLWRSILADAVPSMSELVKTFAGAKREGGLLAGVFASLGAVWEMMKGSPAEQLKRVNEQLALNSAAYDNNALLAKRAALQKIIFDQELAAQDKRALAALDAGKPKPKPDFDTAAYAAAQKAANAVRNEEAALAREMATVTKQGELEAYTLKLQGEAFKGVSAAEKDRLTGIKETIIAEKAQILAEEHLVKLHQQMLSDQMVEIDARDQMLNAFEDGNAQLKLENDTLGMTAAAREIYALGLRKEADLKLALSGKDEEYIKQLYAEREALLLTRDAGQNQLSMWNDISDQIVRAFGRGKDALKDFLRSMLELFAKKWILQIGAALTGSTALSASANALGTGSAAGSLGNLLGLGSAGGLFGGSAAYGAALGTTSIGAGSQAAMLAAQTGEFGSVGLGMTGAAAGGAAGSAASLMAAAGPYVAFALAAYGLYKAFAQKAGGPKEGGSFTGMFNDIGALGTGSSPGWYGVNTANANVQQLVTATGLALGQSISRYGGTTGGFGIGLGYDADPRGTAQSRITSYLKDASGAQLFGNSGMEIGRGNEGVALQLEMSRLLVEGLKASNINEQIKALFTGFDTASATQASIDALIASAEELNGVLGMLASVTISGLTVDSLKAMQAAGESLSQTAARVTGNFAALQDLFSTDAEKMARDQQLIADAFASINVAVPDSIAGFKALIDSLDLSSDSGRSLYNVLIATGPKFKQIQDSMTGMLGAVTQSVVETYNAFATVSANIPTYNPASGYTPGNSEARASLADQLRASLTSEASPYTLAQKYATAKAQFDANLTLAQSGNADAISASFGLFQNFTGLSRQVNASSGQYNTDYFGGLNALGALTAGSARPFTAADYTAGNQQVVQALNANFNAVAAQTAALIENASEINAETVALLERIANATEKPATPGALTSTTL